MQVEYVHTLKATAMDKYFTINIVRVNDQATRNALKHTALMVGTNIYKGLK